jgi:hypothetical protein
MNHNIIKDTAAVTLVIFVGALAAYTHSLAKDVDQVPKAFAISTSSSNSAITTVQNTITASKIELAAIAKVTKHST